MYMLVGPSKVSYHEPNKVPTYLQPPVKPKLTVNAIITKPEWCHTAEEIWYSPKLRLDLRETLKPTKRLWVYNVSRIDHEVDHPQLGKVTIPANTTAKRYALWTSFPDVVIGTSSNLDVGELTTVPESGQWLVNDIIKGGGNGYNRDLSVKGVFWSYNNPPTIKEVNAAVRPMKARYADLLEKAAIIYENQTFSAERVEVMMKEDRCSMAEAFRILRKRYVLAELSPEHHAAAEYFKVVTPWHPVLYT
jgi:hypothetical protein